MAETNVISSLSNLFKIRYPDVLSEWHPSEFIISRDIPFEEATKISGTMEEPVFPSLEQGWRHASPTDDDYTLAAPVRQAVGLAKISAYQSLLRSRIGLGSIVKTNTGKKTSFTRAFDLMVKSMWLSGRKKVETLTIFGASPIGLGTIATVTTGPSGNVTITPSTWAPGVWAGQEGANVQFFNGNTHRADGGDTESSITSVDLGARKLTFDAVPASVAAGDVVWFGSKESTVEMGMHTTSGTQTATGLHAICATSSGTLFNMDMAYSLARPSQYSAQNGTLSFSAAQKAATLLAAKGGYGKYTLYISPLTWTDLLDNEVALRRSGQSDMGGGKTFKVGADGITFYSNIGTLMIKPSPYIPQGFAYMIQPAKFQRLGSKNLSFTIFDQDDYVIKLEERTAYEVRLYTDQATYTNTPGRCVLIKDIVNNE